MKDLFGRDITEEEARRIARKRPATPKRGHAAPVGSGPAGETCGSCAHLVRRCRAGTYLKCGLMRAHWTGGAATDVRAKDAACRMWKREENP